MGLKILLATEKFWWEFYVLPEGFSNPYNNTCKYLQPILWVRKTFRHHTKSDADTET